MFVQRNSHYYMRNLVLVNTPFIGVIVNRVRFVVRKNNSFNGCRYSSMRNRITFPPRFSLDIESSLDTESRDEVRDETEHRH
jgi:hypothetical protein